MEETEAQREAGQVLGRPDPWLQPRVPMPPASSQLSRILCPGPAFPTPSRSEAALE